MARSKLKKLFREYDNDLEEDNYYGSDPKKREQKRNKRLVNILRSKNVDRLIELEEDED
jgi:hypothetical protein